MFLISLGLGCPIQRVLIPLFGIYRIFHQTSELTESYNGSTPTWADSFSQGFGGGERCQPFGCSVIGRHVTVLSPILLNIHMKAVGEAIHTPTPLRLNGRCTEIVSQGLEDIRDWLGKSSLKTQPKQCCVNSEVILLQYCTIFDSYLNQESKGSWPCRLCSSCLWKTWIGDSLPSFNWYFSCRFNLEKKA